MFKRDQVESAARTPAAPRQHGPTPSSSSTRSGPAIIGPSITIKGEVTGDEDLVVQGRIEGTVKLAKHDLTVGSTGRVTADVHGKSVVVEGEVVGDLVALDQIVLRHTAVVEGNVKAPRVALEDGAVFRGGVEMESASKPSGRPKTTPMENRAGAASAEETASKPPSTQPRTAAESS
jgi:cytoskeletal protein CcmA (bactofilin family)